MENNMKLFKYLLPVAVAVCGLVTSAASATEYYHSWDQFNERDYEDVVDFIKTKRIIPVNEKGCDLMISGDIRGEWFNIKEKHDGIRRRGRNALRSFEVFEGAPIPENLFDAEFNLMFDYKGNCTWAVAHVRFDNPAGIDHGRVCCNETNRIFDNGQVTLANTPEVECVGIDNTVYGDPDGCHGSGRCNNVCLWKAYFGYNIFEECNSRLDIEVGRRPLWDIFDSRIQFRNRFDGVLFRYTNAFDCVADFYINLGVFVIDYTTDHYGWVIETGLLDICDYGFDFKYSFINWKKSGQGGCNRCNRDDPWGMRHQVSQFTLYYHLDPEWLCTKAKLYGAFLWNHAAKKHIEYNFKRANIAYYVGFNVGEVRCEGDWYLDINFQVCQAGAIPDCDVSGIGRGNALNRPITLPGQGVLHGNVNYRGFRIEGLYALTDNLALNPKYAYSVAADNDIGGKNTLGWWELELIYAF
jgi:hypothetical protein